MSKELKPCPFCGGDASLIVKEFFGFPEEDVYTVACNDCNSRSCYSDDRKETVKVWNTRPAEDALKAEVERLKAELENALLILKQIDWLYSDANEKARMWELKIGGLSPTEWMCDIVQKTREFIANAPDTNVGTMAEIEVEK